MHRASALLTGSFAILAGVIFGLPSCGSSDDVGFNPLDDGGRVDDGSFTPRPDGGGPRPCTTGLCLKRVSCPGGGDTTITGTVYDPAGKVPLYNAFVFVPNAPLQKIPTGASCDRCDSGSNVYSGDPVSSALTDASGKFTLKNVPVDNNIPLVVQIGKWRRENVKINVTKSCGENPVAAEVTRLPKNSGEGSIPHIALATGGWDSMECLLRRMGLDSSEFSTKGAAGDGRVHLFQGQGSGTQKPTIKFDNDVAGGASFANAGTDMWSNVDQLKAYDMVILSCEGARFPDSKPESARNALYEYEKIGGRVFASHWHDIWFSQGPSPVPAIGRWTNSSQENDRDTQVAEVNEKFPKGKAFSDWLQNVQATSAKGKLPIEQARRNLSLPLGSRAQDWATIPNYMWRKNNVDDPPTLASPPEAVQFVSYNAPLDKPEAEACGRAVYSGLHVSSGARKDNIGQTFPGAECISGDLSPQEKALEFMLFDLSSCISKDTEPPPPPIH
ncbi:hypothetical protein [Pendulispora albinea]|uniref:Carboxypeptidase regulatory-like domain-containing protein n=1 Tax=Pendulispora albinea TaxID=2741071 RepID=A0ABZ2M895_9BACT